MVPHMAKAPSCPATAARDQLPMSPVKSQIVQVCSVFRQTGKGPRNRISYSLGRWEATGRLFPKTLSGEGAAERWSEEEPWGRPSSQRSEQGRKEREDSLSSVGLFYEFDF